MKVVADDGIERCDRLYVIQPGPSLIRSDPGHLLETSGRILVPPLVLVEYAEVHQGSDVAAVVRDDLFVKLDGARLVPGEARVVREAELRLEGVGVYFEGLLVEIFGARVVAREIAHEPAEVRHVRGHFLVLAQLVEKFGPAGDIRGLYFRFGQNQGGRGVRRVRR